MIKVKSLVFCENVTSTEMFTKCLRPIIQQCLSCQHGATASWILPVLFGEYMRLCLRTQHGWGRYRTPTSRFGVRDSTPRPPRPLEYMLTCDTKDHYILPLSDLSKMVIVMTRIPRMIHGIVRVLVSLWFYYLNRPSRKRIRVTKTPVHPTCIYSKTGVYREYTLFSYFCSKT